MTPSRKTIIFAISKVLNIDSSQIDESLSYNDIKEWDSLQHVNLMLYISEKFRLDISAEDTSRLTSVKNIINRGLVNIFYDNSYITNIDHKASSLYYCGFNIIDLVKYCTFEEVAFLLLNNRLPTGVEISDFTSELFSYININTNIKEFVNFHKNLSPIDFTKVFLSTSSYLYSNINSFSAQKKALYIWVNLILCLGQQRALLNNHAFSIPNVNSIPEFCYYMLIDRDQVNSKDIGVLTKDMILHADHESNASTFAARIAASTKADIANSLLSAVSTFEGVLHGGALEKVMDMFYEIKDEINVNNYVLSRINNKIPI